MRLGFSPHWRAGKGDALRRRQLERSDTGDSSDFSGGKAVNKIDKGTALFLKSVLVWIAMSLSSEYNRPQNVRIAYAIY